MPNATHSLHHTPRTLNVAYARVLLLYVQTKIPHAVDAFSASQQACLLEANPLARFALTDWHAMLDTAEQVLQEADLVPILAEQFKPWHAGLMGFTLMTCRNLGEVGALLRRLHGLLNDIFLIERGTVEARFFLRLCHATHEHSHRMARLSLLIWAQRMRWLSGRSDMVLDAHFEGPPPDDVTPYERMLGGTVSFNQSSNTMWGPIAYMALPIVSTDTASHALLQQQAFQQLDTLKQAAPYFKEKLQRVIRHRLSEKALTLTHVAADLKLSPRTLQRRLEETGLNFRLLVDDVRKLQAESYLSDTDISLPELAVALGFADHASFTRAFKRWTGFSPGAFRRQRGTQAGATALP